jgi:hypothetical protein
MSNFDIATHEFEFKYDATGVKLGKFKAFAEKHDPLRFIEVASWDTYYANKDTKSNIEFMRFRQGPSPELTIKSKLNENNNNKRIEIDLPLDNHRLNESVVKAYCDSMGFEENFRLYKVCFIYFYEKVDIVYYISYNEEMKEVGRYVEVEARKDVAFDTSEEAWDAVIQFEQKLAYLGITPQNRMKKSQWEINRK